MFLMADYYCHKCGANHGYLRSMQTNSLTATDYQLAKYMKHTAPDSQHDVQSVFTSASTQAYENYIISSALSGSVEVDDQRRTNIIWAAGREVGFKYESGQVRHPEDVVKVVLSTDSGKIHAYSQSSTQFSSASCSDCSGNLLY